MKMKMKKCGRMSSNFEFSISRLGYVAVFMKISETKFHPFFKTFLTNWGKDENEDEKIEKMSLVFEFSISKLGYMEFFIKIWENFFLEILTLRMAY